MKRSEEGGHPSRALAKGIAILDELARVEGPVSLADVSRAIDLGKASTLRLLKTLEGLGYVKREDGSVRLERLPAGVSGSLTAATRPEESDEAIERAMRALAVETGETVSYARLFDDHIRVVKVLESPRLMRMSNFVGRILQPYASALGKAITAYQSDELRRRLVSVYGLYQFTPATIADPASIEAEFAKVRESGFAYDLEETVEGGCCVAAPIFSQDGSVRAAVSVSQPKGRYSEEIGRKRERLLESVKRPAG